MLQQIDRVCVVHIHIWMVRSVMTGFFHSIDSHWLKQTVNTGLILGFVQFDTPGFPSPGNVDKYTANDIPLGIIDNKFCVVAWCVEKYYNFDAQIITEIELKECDKGVHIIPMEHLLGTVCVIPNLFTQNRMRQD